MQRASAKLAILIKLVLTGLNETETTGVGVWNFEIGGTIIYNIVFSNKDTKGWCTSSIILFLHNI